MTAPSASRRAVFGVFLALLVVTATLAVSEIASRAMRRFVCAGRGLPVHTPDADYGWTHEPNVRQESHACIGRDFEYRVLFQTNAQGLPDDETPIAKPPGVERVLLLGDSVIEAAHVEREKSVAHRLEELLADRAPKVEVVNTGVAGFSLHNELLFYRSEGAAYGAGLVVVVFNLHNDPAEISPSVHRADYAGPNALPTAGLRITADGTLEVDTSEYRRTAESRRTDWSAAGAWDWLVNRVYLLRRLQGLLHTDVAPAAKAPSNLRMHVVPESEDFADAWRFVEAALRTLDREIKAHGARLAVAVVPSKELVDDAAWNFLSDWYAKHLPPGARYDRDAPHRRILGLLDQLALPYIDLTPGLQDEAKTLGRSVFYENDPHPTAEGHERLARDLAPWLAGQLEGP
jgi:hypothetical protein